MKQAQHVALCCDIEINLLPVFEPFIPVPVATELSAKEGWAAFTAAVRNSEMNAAGSGKSRHDGIADERGRT